MIQSVLNAAIVFLAKEMMEEVEPVYFQTNAVEIQPVENVLEELISNAVLVEPQLEVVQQPEVVQQLEAHLEKHTMAHAMVVEELALILLELVAILVLLMENALVDQVLNVVLLEENLHGI